MPWSRFKSYDDQQYDTELRKFVRYVTQVVSSSPAQNINRFRVCIPLDKDHKDDLQTWLNLAMAKRVKELELNLSRPTEIASCGKCLSVGPFGCYIQSPGAKSLVSLSLTTLHTSGPFLDSVLFNLPNLERLTMTKLYCGQKSHIRVVGSSLKLRYLEISDCNGVGKLDISANNLISFVLRGHKEDVKFNSIPMLNEVSFGGSYAVRLIHNFQPISGLFSQLTKLTLTSISECWGISRSPIHDFPRFRKLKQLELEIPSSCYMSLPFLTNFIDACPVLHRFMLQCKLRHPQVTFDGAPRGYVRVIDTVPSKLHHHLNTFEMVGFEGCKEDMDLILYLAQFAILLETVILHPLLEDYFGHNKEGNSRKQAKLLGDQLPARVQLY